MGHSTEQDKWNKISTVSDYITFLEDDSIDWKNLTESFINPEISGCWTPANTGWHDRPLLKITGTLTHDSWVHPNHKRIFDYDD